MTEIYVDHQRLLEAQHNFARHHEQLHAILSELESGLAPMLASWDGSARQLYAERKAQWDAAALDLSALLKSIVELTRTAHEGYSRLVAANVAAWS